VLGSRRRGRLAANLLGRVGAAVHYHLRVPLLLIHPESEEHEAADLAGFDAALQRAGLAVHPADGDGRLVKAEPEAVARAAMADGVVLHRLAPPLAAGLERLFFQLTAGDAAEPQPQTNSTNPELVGAAA
jgi:hypothetical protein